jgi:hypothetical protein
MDRDRDLLPWILGGLSMAAVAIAITVSATNRTAAAKSQSPNQTIVAALPQTEPIAASVPASVPPPAPSLAIARAQTPGSPIETNGQIWECTLQGQKTFSDKPCGAKSSLRVLGPINTMDAPPLVAQGRAYGPQPSYQPSYQPGYDPGYSDASDPGVAYNSYPVVLGVPARERRRSEQAHRPQGRHPGPSVRKN